MGILFHTFYTYKLITITDKSGSIENVSGKVVDPGLVSRQPGELRVEEGPGPWREHNAVTRDTKIWRLRLGQI